MASKADLKRIGSGLRAKRTAMGLRQNVLARKVGISNKTLNNYEDARYWPSLRTYIDLCRELNAGEVPMVGN